MARNAHRPQSMLARLARQAPRRGMPVTAYLLLIVAALIHGGWLGVLMAALGMAGLASLGPED